MSRFRLDPTPAEQVPLEKVGWVRFRRIRALSEWKSYEKVNPAFTSQRCSVCGTVDREARESQAI